MNKPEQWWRTITAWLLTTQDMKQQEMIIYAHQIQRVYLTITVHYEFYKMVW